MTVRSLAWANKMTTFPVRPRMITVRLMGLRGSAPSARRRVRLAWTQTLAFDEHEPARRWKPKRLRLRVLAVAGRIIRNGRRRSVARLDPDIHSPNYSIQRSLSARHADT
jgi:hypothetical protein